DHDQICSSAVLPILGLEVCAQPCPATRLGSITYMTRTWSDRRLGLRSAPRFSTPLDGRLFTERDGRLMLAWPWNAKTTRRADRAWVRARAHPLNCAMRAIGYARAPVLPEALAYLTPSAFRARRSVLSAILSAVASLSTSVAGRSPYAN